MRAPIGRAALGLAAWMLFHGSAEAQVSRGARPDTVPARADTLSDSARVRRDSLAALARAEEQRRAADSIKAPLAHAPVPVLTDVADSAQWDREGILSTGALTLGELIDPLPGVTVFRSGWIGSPHQAAYLGAFDRVRVYYDGLEMDPLDHRTGGVLDLSMLDTWPLEDARVEQVAGEMRVYLRSWRQRSTTPETRVDFSTGDVETNTYRGFFGRRFPGGAALQLGAYHYSTVDVNNGGDADQTTLWGRLGWARGKWSVDASTLRGHRSRTDQSSTDDLSVLPGFDGTRTTSYLRAAYGDPDSGGRWLQFTLGSQRLSLSGPTVQVIDSVPGPGGGGPGGSVDNPDTLSVKADTNSASPQYVLATGWGRGPIRLSATGRLRRFNGSSYTSQSVRASYRSRRLTLAAFMERAPEDSLRRLDLSGRFVLASWLRAAGGLSRYTPLSGAPIPTSTAVRGELAVRLGRVWISGGMLQRNAARLIPPIVFDTGLAEASQGQTKGYFATLRGKFWKDLGVNVSAIRYASEGVYLPQYQARSALYFDSGLLQRFPSGHLHIHAEVSHEYRTQAFFPLAAGDTLESSQYRSWNAMLEIRLLTATLTYQYRDFFDEVYQQVPGYRMPGPVNFYGIRWYFYN